MDGHNIFIDFLEKLGVPYTPGYSTGRYDGMAFKSLFGLQQLLKEYGVDSEGLSLADKSELTCLQPPFIASTASGLVIITGITPERIEYMSQGVDESMDTDSMLRAFTGNVFVAYPTAESVEPDYSAHRRDIFIAKGKRVCLVAGLAALFLYLFIANGIYSHISTVLLTLCDFAGLTLTYMLLQKSLKIHNRHADAVCRVLQEGGCDSILETKASSFYGIFSWSELGFAYFSISLLTLLIFPQYIGYLALINICCLPFTFWSIWYQKFRAKVWCTLCVSVQATLWLSFFCYLGGGWLRQMFPLSIQFFVLAATYGVTLLALNRILPKFAPSKDNSAQ